MSWKKACAGFSRKHIAERRQAFACALLPNRRAHNEIYKCLAICRGARGPAETEAINPVLCGFYATSNGASMTNLSLMADAPKVSIVMPVRNAAGTLAVALESVRCQTFPDWELVAVDDGSTDETAEILVSTAHADPRIR